jgi:DNA-binding transcriptional MerR regulator
LDKSPDAFRTISEVADDLDIPQHVLRFWETRFTQIKPMKRSGGRRYYRPDDVDLLRGIRRLLYGEGYTIRGVQRILKEYGIKAVQGLVDGTSSASFAGIEAGIEDALREPAEYDEDAPELEADEDEEDDELAEEAIVGRVFARRVADFAPPARRSDPAAQPEASVVAAENGSVGRKVDSARLKAVLDDLIACRQLLDQALTDG